MAETILYEVARRIATITLNRPEKLNAISRQLQAELLEAIEEAERDDAVRVVVLRGAGRSFCAGYDLAGSGDGVGASQSPSISADRDGLIQFINGWLRIWDARVPVIAQVHGHCIAGGSQLAVICDVTITAEEARIGAPALPLGAGFVSCFWAWQVGAKKAKELFFPVGSNISGAEAARLGLFNFAVPQAELEDRVREFAASVAKTPKEILVLQKHAMNRTEEIKGFRQAMLQGAEYDAIAHFTEPVLAMNQSIRDLGLRGAIAAWNAEQ